MGRSVGGPRLTNGILDPGRQPARKGCLAALESASLVRGGVKRRHVILRAQTPSSIALAAGSVVEDVQVLRSPTCRRIAIESE